MAFLLPYPSNCLAVPFHPLYVLTSDLLIGATALSLGFKVLTGNLRHFQRIPGLAVVQL
jgi:hypothetical protein